MAWIILLVMNVFFLHLQSHQVKRTAPRFHHWIHYYFEKMNLLVVPQPVFQIQICISACVTSSEFLATTSQFLVGLKNLWMDEMLWKHLHQIQENWAGRNFITSSCGNSLLNDNTHAGMQRWIWNLQYTKYQWI